MESAVNGGDSVTLFKEDEVEVIKEIPLRQASNIADMIFTMTDTYCDKIEIVGSIRRLREKINDVDFVVLTDDNRWKQIKKVMTGLLGAKIVCSGDKILRTLMEIQQLKGHVQVDFYRATKDNYGVLKLIRTGSADHNVWLAQYAIKKGMRLLYSKGLIKDGEVAETGEDESLIFSLLDLPFVPPEQREIGKKGEPIWRV